MAKKKDNTMVYKILAYIGILWIIGLFVPEREDKSVKFHVGQGMLITIVLVVVSLINDLVISQIFAITKYNYWGFKEYQMTSSFGNVIMWMLSLIPIALSIIGIINAIKNKDEELPLIGKYAFYK